LIILADNIATFSLNQFFVTFQVSFQSSPFIRANLNVNWLPSFCYVWR